MKGLNNMLKAIIPVIPRVRKKIVDVSKRRKKKNY